MVVARDPWGGPSRRSVLRPVGGGHPITILGLLRDRRSKLTQLIEICKSVSGLRFCLLRVTWYTQGMPRHPALYRKMNNWKCSDEVLRTVQAPWGYICGYYYNHTQPALDSVPKGAEEYLVVEGPATFEHWWSHNGSQDPDFWISEGNDGWSRWFEWGE